VVANSLIMLASNLIYHAHLQFIGAEKKPIFLSIILLITTISLLIIFTYINPNTNNRIIVLSTFYGVQFLLITSAIGRFQRQTQQVCYTPLMVIATVFALFHSFRLVITLLTSDSANSYKLANSWTQALLVIVLMLYIVALDFFIVFIATEKLIQKIAELAYKDSLTELYNRRGLDYAIQDKPILKESFAVIICDIDHFKLVNDRYGHDVGDIVIQEFSGLIKELTRKTDICARWGGEEFLIILPLTDEQEALIVAEKIRSACEQQRFKEQPDLLFTSSFGICVKKDGENFDSLIKSADQALYQAKNQGRNQVCIFKTAKAGLNHPDSYET
jgi:diguanylate cyclase (GGDEF)-like protein